MIKIYIDTSVLNFYFADDFPLEKTFTCRLFDAVRQGYYEAYISSTVLEEINAAEEEIREKLLSLVKDYELKVLVLNEEVENLAMEYISEGVIPEKYAEDAYHIAFTVINNLDILISWNFDHIVKLKTKKMVNGISYLKGLKVIEICTPGEVEYEF